MTIDGTRLGNEQSEGVIILLSVCDSFLVSSSFIPLTIQALVGSLLFLILSRQSLPMYRTLAFIALFAALGGQGTPRKTVLTDGHRC